MGQMRAGRVHSLAEAATWLQKRLEQQQKHGLTMWAVQTPADNSLVGACGVIPQGAELELAYIISHEQRGRQFAAEAASLVLDALRAAGIRTPVYATIRPSNMASRRVAESLGLRCVEKRTDDLGSLLVYRELGAAPEGHPR